MISRGDDQNQAIDKGTPPSNEDGSRDRSNQDSFMQESSLQNLFPKSKKDGKADKNNLSRHNGGSSRTLLQSGLPQFT